MKKNKYTKWILALVSFLIMVSCVDTDINRDPTTSSNMDPNMQITSIQVLPNSDRNSIHRYFIFPGGFMNHWSNDWAVTTYGGSGQGHDGYNAQLWEDLYPVVITNVVDVVERTRGVEEKVNVHAAARVLKVENFLRLTDYYGDVPYSEAGMAYYGGIFSPKYDKQEDIYTDMLKELKEAAAQFDAAKPTLTADLYFAGDLSKWGKYANSLRLRIALRLVKVKPDVAKTEAEDAAKAGVMTSNDDICFVSHEDILSQQNASAGNAISNIFFDGVKSNFRITREVVKILEDRKDPRLPMYASSYLEDGDNNSRTDITAELLAVYGSYQKIAIPAQCFNGDEEAIKGLTNNIEITTSKGQTVKVSFLNQFLQANRMIVKANAPHIRMGYAEVEFLLADAILRKFAVGGTAEDHYKKGIEAAVKQMELFGAKVDAGQLTTYVNANPLKTGTEDGLNDVNTQLWVLHFLDPIEAWSNVRRSGYPVDEVKFYNRRPKLNTSEGKRPSRIPYPVSEQTINKAQYDIAVENMPGTIKGDSKDHWNNNVWWDKQ